MKTTQEPRVLLRIARDRLRAVEIEDIYYLEATGQTTRVRIRSARPLRDLRSLGELASRLGPHGFVRIHRNHMVNLAHVRELRRRNAMADWEVKLEPPVNKVLPVSRARLATLRRALDA